MPVPVHVSDGDFKQALQVGPTEFSFPFAEKGDSSTFIAHVKRIQDQAYYRKPILMARGDFGFMGRAYLVDMGEPRSIGQGLLEWTERWAALPINRVELGSTVYTQQVLARETAQDQSVTFSVQEYSATRDAVILFEYSINSPLPTKIAPRWATFNSNAGSVIVAFGGISQVTFNQQILAEDSVSEIWLGRIYERKSILVRYTPFVEVQ